MRGIRIFNITINPLSRAEFIDIISLNLQAEKLLVQNGVNAASIVELVHNDALKEAYNNSDLINIDGMSLVWTLRILGYKVPERVSCPDLADDVLCMAEKNGYKVFFWGAKEESLQLCITRVLEKYPLLGIAGYRNGYFSDNEEKSIFNQINESDTDILFLGMPSPRKELLVMKYRKQINPCYILGVGGYFDILAGFTKRAPLWLQKTGLEWVYRLLQEPKRMWKRYILGNFQFIAIIIKEIFRRRKA